MNSADQKKVKKTGNLPAEWLNGVSSALSDNRPPAALVFLPEHIEEQRAIYPSELTYVVKNMRSEGVDAAFLDAPKGRAFRSKFSADATPVVIGILLSVLSNGIYDLLKVSFALLRAEAKKNAQDQRQPFEPSSTNHPKGRPSFFRKNSPDRSRML